MDEHAVGDVAYERLESGYGDQWELLRDMFALLDYRLYLFYKYHQWVGPGNDMKNMLGLVVTREEFEHNLKKSEQLGLRQRVDPSERQQIETGETVVAQRLAQTDADIPMLGLFERLRLSAFERQCVVLAYAAEIDKKYERLFAYLQDDITLKTPTVSLAVQLYLPEGRTMEEYVSAFDTEDAFTALFVAERRQAGVLQLRPCVASFLADGVVRPPSGMTLFDGAYEKPDGPIVTHASVADGLDRALAGGRSSVIALSGAPGSGRRFQIKHLMARREEHCLFVDLSAPEGGRRAIEEGALLARIAGAHLCFHGIETRGDEGETNGSAPALLDDITSVCRDFPQLFLVSERPVRCDMGRVAVEFELEPPNVSGRLMLFEHYLRDIPLTPDVTPQELAAKFRFEPLQVRRACEQAEGFRAIEGKERVDGELLHRCCYKQVVHKLDALATRVIPNFTWDDVVLPAAQKELMRQAVAHVRYAHTVYHDWGFERKLSYGRGLSILFAGAPGTGKTMCAQVIAKQLNMELYKINISQIVSKYIGETEKNLSAVFAEARKSSCILFFDECDAIFGKRSEVKDAHDRNANVEVAYLLQQIEEHDGVCILATNLMQNMDAAFMRRITFVVHFPFPDSAMRREIYLRTLPPAAPVDGDIDWDFMAEKFNLSGGHIKNIVVGAAFMAASQGEPIGMRHVLRAAVNELKKNEIVVVREELREYADLVF